MEDKDRGIKTYALKSQHFINAKCDSRSIYVVGVNFLTRGLTKKCQNEWIKPYKKYFCVHLNQTDSCVDQNDGMF